MRIVRPGEEVNRIIARNSVFLAGPTPRDKTGLPWRPKAIELFSSVGISTLFIPTPFVASHNKHEYNYEEQIDWEDRALRAASVVMFWVPRDLVTMPAFTTNVEFGMYVKSGKMIYGRPDGAPKTGYLDWHAKKNNVPIATSLEGAVLLSAMIA